MPTPIDRPIGVNIEVVGGTLDENEGCVKQLILQVESCVVVNGTGERNLLVGEGARRVCRGQRVGLSQDALESIQPGVVITGLTSGTYTVMTSGDTPGVHALSTSDLLEAAPADSLDRFVASGARVVAIEPLPNSRFKTRYLVDDFATVGECQFAVLDSPAAERLFYRSVAGSNDRATAADLTDIVCPRFPTGGPIVEGVLVREDLDHLSLDFTRLMASQALPRFDLSLRSAGFNGG